MTNGTYMRDADRESYCPLRVITIAFPQYNFTNTNDSRLG